MMVGPFYRARGKPLADGHDHLVERIALGSHRHCTSVGGPGRQGQGAVKVCWPPWSQLALRRWTNGFRIGLVGHVLLLLLRVSPGASRRGTLGSYWAGGSTGAARMSPRVRSMTFSAIMGQRFLISARAASRPFSVWVRCTARKSSGVVMDHHQEVRPPWSDHGLAPW